MLLLFFGLVLAILTSFVVRRAATRAWHYAVIVALAMALMPLLASTVTGDLSRHLPASTFSEGPDGKDQIIVASVAATVLAALLIAAGILAAARLALRRVRRT